MCIYIFKYDENITNQSNITYPSITYDPDKYQLYIYSNARADHGAIFFGINLLNGKQTIYPLKYYILSAGDSIIFINNCVHFMSMGRHIIWDCITEEEKEIKHFSEKINRKLKGLIGTVVNCFFE